MLQLKGVEVGEYAMNHTVSFGFLIIFVVIVAAIVWVRWIVKRMDGPFAPDTGERLKRRPILANPIFWIYVATVIVWLSIAFWALRRG
jgi:amino acid transporter